LTVSQCRDILHKQNVGAWHACICDNCHMVEIVNLADIELPILAERCAKVLARSGLAVVPTDTVYGLAAKADDPVAVGKVFEVKGREAEKALVVMVSDSNQAMELVASEQRGSLLRLGSLWPGPLTLVVKVGDLYLRRNVAPYSDTLGIRVPASRFMLRLLELSGPLAVTSANFVGGRAPASFHEVDRQLLAMVDIAVDGGECGSGRPSTVAELSGGEVRILRHGEIGEMDLQRALRGE
jgi:L-threonylcarbamoyladenylate synthase